MTTRRASRRSFSRGSKPIMSWFNDGVDLATLAGSTSLTSPLLQNVILPVGFASGYTILRMIGRIVFAANTATSLVNAVAAIWTAPTLSLTTPPNLNADLLDYYYFTGLQAPEGVVGASGPQMGERIFDIRSARRVRGEERGMFFRVTNNTANLMQVGLEFRMLLKKS